jgi:prolyl-tRNA editing enzyme YbaK/EbsC (Cys-tRNA(Pro) deacylase)
VGATDRPGVARVRAALALGGAAGEVVVLDDTSRTAADAAEALGVSVGQIASSLVFTLPGGGTLLVITSGRHRVDTGRVAAALGVDALGRADADHVKRASGFSIGGVAPVGWAGDAQPVVLIDSALADYDVVWAAGGHPHAVFPTSFDELVRLTGASPVRVSDD